MGYRFKNGWFGGTPILRKPLYWLCGIDNFDSASARALSILWSYGYDPHVFWCRSHTSWKYESSPVVTRAFISVLITIVNHTQKQIVTSFYPIDIYIYIMSYDLCYSLLISIKKKTHVDKNPMLQLLHIPGILRSKSSEHSEHCPWRPSMGLARDPRDLWICSWRIFHMVRWKFPTFRGAPVR